jgi:hypothetical protein
MIRWLLREMEKDPSRLFMEKELAARSNKDYERAKTDGFLDFARLEVGKDYVPCPDRCALPCSGMRLTPPPAGSKGIAAVAFCDQDPDVDPLPFTRKDLAAYRLNLDTVSEKIREINSFNGKPSRLDNHLLYLGEAQAGGFTLAVVLALFPDARAASEALLALPNMLSGRPDRCLAVFPTLQITDQAALVNLENHDVYTTTLTEKDPFKIDLSTALKKAPARPVIVTLTPAQEKEFTRHGFKSRLPIEITGEVERRADNIIRVAGAKVPLEDAEYRLFLRLAVELFKGGDGSIYKGDPTARGGLVDEGILRPDSIDQTIHRLRGKFTPALQGLSPRRFIEAYRQKNIRLSTHPAYISFDKDRLLHHHDVKIQQLAIYLQL